jgi:polysaccharide biosynthesis protein PslH
VKEILLVHHRLPYPLDNGMDKLRFNLIRALSNDYKVTLIVPIYKNTSPENINEVKKIVNELHCVVIRDKNSLGSRSGSYKIKRITALVIFNLPFYCFETYHADFKMAILKLVANNNYLFIQFLSDFSAYYSKFISKDQFIIVGPMDDMIETNRSYRTQLKSPKDKLLNAQLSKAIVHYFRSICSKANIIFFHSTEDAERVIKKIRTKFEYKILQVSTAPSQNFFSNAHLQETNSIVFTGGLGTHFNQDAVKYLVEDIFPIIEKKLPDAKLYIVGNHPPQFILDYGIKQNVIITGAVESVDDYVRKAAVYVSPIRMGTGIKTKIIEAMSFGKAIVATTASLQGLWNVDDCIAIADNPQEFAKAVVGILKEQDLQRSFQNKSGSVFEQYYSLEKNEPSILATYKSILEPSMTN